MMPPRHILRVALWAPVALILLVSCGLTSAAPTVQPGGGQPAVITIVPPTVLSIPTSRMPAEQDATAVSRSMSTSTPVETVLPGFRTYVNTRYGYLIQFPQSWPSNAESASDSELRFFPGQADMDIHVYALHFSKDTPSPYSNADKPNMQYQNILLSSGKQAVLLVGRDGQNILYELVWVFGDTEGIEIHFYANIPEPFFAANERTLLTVAKSIDLLPGAVTITPENVFGPTPSYPTPTPEAGVAQGWQSYSNDRFGFTIWFPETWSRGAEGMNGDGAPLYIGNPDLDIRAYGEHQDVPDPVKAALKPGYQQTAITLHNGKQATLITGKSGDNVIFETIFIADRIVYSFYATVPDRFYRENEQTLLEIAKSMATRPEHD